MVSNKSPNLGLEYFMASDSHLTHSPAWVVMMGFMYSNVCISSFDKGQGIPIYRKFFDADAPQTCLAYFFFSWTRTNKRGKNNKWLLYPPKALCVASKTLFIILYFQLVFPPFFCFSVDSLHLFTP